MGNKSIGKLMKNSLKIFFYSLLVPFGIKKNKDKNLLIVRLDAIGDYVLFRNFLEELKKDKKYSGYKITLCGNEIWRNLFESFDNNFVNNVIWIDIVKFRKNPIYIYKIVKKVRNIGYHTAINPMYSRTLESDLLIKISGAIEKKGWIGTKNNIDKETKKKTDSWYTELFMSEEKYQFEFNRNKEFFERMLNKEVDIKKPHFTHIPKINFELPENFVVIFPGASSFNRQWAAENFAEVANLLIKKSYKIILAGGIKEKENGRKIMSRLENNTLNLIGKTSLTELVYIISKAKLLVSNDTSAVHLAVSTSTPTVCISNGNTFGRFTSYPEEIFNKIEYVYPDEIDKNSFQENYDQFSFDSKININTIKPSKVEMVIEKILK